MALLPLKKFAKTAQTFIANKVLKTLNSLRTAEPILAIIGHGSLTFEPQMLQEQGQDLFEKRFRIKIDLEQSSVLIHGRIFCSG